MKYGQPTREHLEDMLSSYVCYNIIVEILSYFVSLLLLFVIIVEYWENGREGEVIASDFLHN